jgi:hypothetical protein
LAKAKGDLQTWQEKVRATILPTPKLNNLAEGFIKPDQGTLDPYGSTSISHMRKSHPLKPKKKSTEKVANRVASMLKKIQEQQEFLIQTVQDGFLQPIQEFIQKDIKQSLVSS